jgi:hypothetical protein
VKVVTAQSKDWSGNGSRFWASSRILVTGIGEAAIRALTI